MNRILAGLALAGALWGCEAKTAPPPVTVTPPPPPTVAAAPAPSATYTERVKIDDV
jgi:hypothetical protein